MNVLFRSFSVTVKSFLLLRCTASMRQTRSTKSSMKTWRRLRPKTRRSNKTSANCRNLFLGRTMNLHTTRHPKESTSCRASTMAPLSITKCRRSSWKRKETWNRKSKTVQLVQILISYLRISFGPKSTAASLRNIWPSSRIAPWKRFNKGSIGTWMETINFKRTSFLTSKNLPWK